MRRINKRLVIGVFGLLAVLFVVCSNSESVHAETTVNIQRRIMDKVIYQGVHKCYNNGSVRNNVELDNYQGMESLMDQNAGNDVSYVKLVSGSHGGLMDLLINSGSLRYNVESDALSCYQLFVGGSHSAGIAEANGEKVPDANSEQDEINKFLRNMGYSISDGGDGGVCFSTTFRVYGNQIKSKNKLCQRDGKLFTEPSGSIEPSGVAMSFGVKGDDEVCLKFATSNGTQTRCGVLKNVEDGKTLNQSSFVATIQDICKDGGKKGECTFTGYDSSLSYVLDDSSSANLKSDSMAGRNATFANEDGTPDGNAESASRTAIKFLSNNSVYVDGNLAIDKAETRILYQEYLTQYYGYEIDCSTEHVNTDTITWFDNASGEIKDCSITKKGDKSGKVHGVAGEGVGVATGEDNFGVDISSEEIVKYLSEKHKEDYTEDELAEMGAIASGAREDDVNNDCRNSSAGKGLGWLLCSVLELAGSAVEGIYDGLIEPRLGVNPKLFSSGSTSDEQIPYFAWQQFRDIANMIFVILLLVVLFSQLTGVGIDNYGIKRILPKLIVSAILINLSYLICILVIDVSNIVGNGAAALFDNLGRSLPTTVNLSTDSGAVGATGATGSLVTVGLAAGMATMVGSIWTAGPLILVTLLPTVLSALVAFLFLFLLLSARQAAVVVLVVLSPLAVACNILPNTKSFFDRYLKAFKLLMLVYPIASVLISGGNYVSKLILQIKGDGDNFFLALTSMVVGIAPIFFIPSMIKDSFVGLGKIGGALSGFGRAAGNKAAGVLRGNEGFKDLQRMGTERRARKLAGVGADGKIKPLGTLGTIMRGGRRRVSEARSQYMSDQASEAARSELLNGGLFAQRLESAEEARALKASREMYANMDRKGLSDDAGEINTWLKEKGGYQRAAMLMEAMVNKGMQTDVYKMLENNNFSGSSSVMNSLAGSSDKILKAYGKKAAGNGTSFTSFMNGTGKGAGGETITLKKYAGEKGASFLSGLDDKALELIKGYSTGSNQIMSTNQLLGAAKSMDSDDALVWINKMLKGRNDISFSAADYFDYDESIRETIRQKYRYHDASVMQSVQAAVEAIDNDPSLASKMGKDDALFFGSIPRSSGGGTP